MARPAEPPMPYALLAACCIGMFAASCSGTTRAPFLVDMARDLSTNVALVGNLVAMSSVSWGLASLLAGAGSDRFGRKLFLLGGPVLLMLTMFGVAQAESFLSVAIWVTVSGFFAGGFVGVLYAEVSARVEDGQRGRALGWVMAGQSMTLLVGVPMAAFLGAYIGWRGVNLVVAGLVAVAAVGLLVTTYGRPSGQRAAGAAAISVMSVLRGRVLMLLLIGITERICYGLTAVYFATFLQVTYDLPLEAVAIPLVVFALGNILGTMLGGQLADRLANRMRTFAVALLASGVAALALFGWREGVVTSVALGFVYVFLNAIARPSLLASLAQVPADIRGTVMGLNVTSASFGWLGAASVGGWLIGTTGFGAFGPLAAGVALLGAGLSFSLRK